uniref:DC_STAMP domain-containing protein n=1 Tax=Rhabditophanes sp. KR3021 TaxID=114890 RepID=A0AC35TMI5_9BILA
MIFFALSPTFRCILVVAGITTLGRSGIGIVSWKIIDNIMEGPIDNIRHNFQETALAFTCFASMQKSVTEERFNLAVGPLEHFLQQNIANGIKVSKKIISTIRLVIQPFMSDLKDEDTEEDISAKGLKKYATDLETREMAKNGITSHVDDAKGDASQSVLKYSKFRNKLTKKLLVRIEDRCMEMFNSVSAKCIGVLETVKQTCYSNLFDLLAKHVCPKFDQEQYCTMSKQNETRNTCQSLMKGKSNELFPESMDEEMDSFKNSTNTITDEINLNVHLKRYDSERKLNVKLMGQLSNMVHSEVHYLHLALNSLREFLNLWVLLFVFVVFEDSIIFCRNFLTDVEFQNFYLTKYFWRIDKNREHQHKSTLYPLSNAEKKINKVGNVFGWPTKKERGSMKLPLILWVTLVSLVVAAISVDHYFYRVLSVVNDYGNFVFRNAGANKISLQIRGEGIFVDWLREILEFNFTRSSNTTINAKGCNKLPNPPNYSTYKTTLLMPLLYLFVFHILLNYMIKRITVVFVMGYMFRKRHKTRIIYLYNKILYSRENSRRMARAKVRYEAKRQSMYHKDNALMWMFKDGFVKTKIINKYFKLYRCLLCDVKYSFDHIIMCLKCPASYCTKCFVNNEKCCYACYALEDKVNSLKSQIEKPLNYKEKIDRIKNAIKGDKRVSFIIEEKAQ